MTDPNKRHNASLTTEQVREIKKMLKTKPVYIVARRFGITYGKAMRIYITEKCMETLSRKWAILDDDGTPIRFFDYEAVGTVRWPIINFPKTLADDDPEWKQIPF